MIDAELRPRTASIWETLELLPRLEPHGAANPAPLFMSRSLEVRELRKVGTNHLRVRLSHPSAQLTAIGFGMADASLAAGDCLDVVYRLKRNVWRDSVAPELELVDWRAARV